MTWSELGERSWTSRWPAWSIGVFLQASLAAGLAVVVRPLAASAQSASFHALATASDPGWQGSITTAARRIDGRAKVVGAKLYAADFRAQDLPSWPRPQRC